MIIGKGGYSKVWHPPRRDRLIQSEYRGNDDYVERVTLETFPDITSGQYARKIFDPTNKRSSPLITVYERPNHAFSEIRPFRDDTFYELLTKYITSEDLKLFCRLSKKIDGVFRGLVALHKRGRIHHDIKPQNILYNKRPFEIFLIDWGTAIPFAQVFDYRYYNWLVADNFNHPPEYKIYANYRFGHRYAENNFAQDYANNYYIFSLLKIQPEYMKMLNKANTDLQRVLRKENDDIILKQIAPKVDVFAIGLVLAQAYLVMAYSTMYNHHKKLHQKIIHILKKMTHPNPLKRWTMRHSAEYFQELLPEICRVSK